jgi:hypothetical protein
MLAKLLILSCCFILTALFGGSADFEYSEPGVCGTSHD